MNEQLFIQTVHRKAKVIGMNPLLLLSGIEGLYTFRTMPLNAINYNLLDSLILTIFALRIGDRFHASAEEDLKSGNTAIQQAAERELAVMDTADIVASGNPLLPPFAQMLNGKAVVRKYHEKALEAAAVEIQKVQSVFGQQPISTVLLHVCKEHLAESLDLGSWFGQ